MPVIDQIKKLEGILDPLIKKRYLKYFQLPQDIRQTIFAVETADQIRKIGQENNLNKDQLWWASYTAGMILLGETNIINFVKTLQVKCDLSKEPARQLARQINQAIFLPAKESLKKIHQVPEWPREEEAPVGPTPPSAEKPLSTPETATLEESKPSDRKDIYQEPIEESLSNQIEPRLKGNLVDLKGEK